MILNTRTQTDTRADNICKPTMCLRKRVHKWRMPADIDIDVTSVPEPKSFAQIAWRSHSLPFDNVVVFSSLLPSTATRRNPHWPHHPYEHPPSYPTHALAINQKWSNTHTTHNSDTRKQTEHVNLYVYLAVRCVSTMKKHVAKFIYHIRKQNLFC